MPVFSRIRSPAWFQKIRNPSIRSLRQDATRRKAKSGSVWRTGEEAGIASAAAAEAPAAKAPEEANNDDDIPDDILAQLGNRIQHALRAYTPKDQKAVKTAAETFRANPEFKTADAIMELGTGEALVSFLDEKGAPSVVERAKILPPKSQMGPIDEMTRNRQIQQNNLYIKYEAVKIK